MLKTAEAISICFISLTLIGAVQTKTTNGVSSIRAVDFKNYTYPSNCGRDMKDPKVPPQITVKEGVWSTGNTDQDTGFSVSSTGPLYGNVTRSGHEQAVVVGFCGKDAYTWTFAEIYVFDVNNGNPVLLGRLPTPNQDMWGMGFAPTVFIAHGGISVTYPVGGSRARPDHNAVAIYRWNQHSFTQTSITSQPLTYK